jgi:hypothetical protein
MVQKYNIWIILTSLRLFLFCVKKQPMLWRGDYADLVTPEELKEDFKIGDYLVVAYAPVEKHRRF